VTKKLLAKRLREVGKVDLGKNPNCPFKRLYNPKSVFRWARKIKLG